MLLCRCLSPADCRALFVVVCCVTSAGCCMVFVVCWVFFRGWYLVYVALLVLRRSLSLFVVRCSLPVVCCMLLVACSLSCAYVVRCFVLGVCCLLWLCLWSSFVGRRWLLVVWSVFWCVLFLVRCSSLFSSVCFLYVIRCVLFVLVCLLHAVDYSCLLYGACCSLADAR